MGSLYAEASSSCTRRQRTAYEVGLTGVVRLSGLLQVSRSNKKRVTRMSALSTNVAEREWHRSQQLAWRADGSLVLELEVCLDQALRPWAAALVDEISDVLSRAREVYTKPVAAWTRASIKPVAVDRPEVAGVAS